jgi:hypothetical protein
VCRLLFLEVDLHGFLDVFRMWVSEHFIRVLILIAFKTNSNLLLRVVL